MSTRFLSPLAVRALPLCLLLACLTLVPPDPVRAQEGSPFAVAIEEDWELVVATPDLNSVAPQVSCTMSPHLHLDSLHATFELNHQTLPEFVPGGLQLLAWSGETHLKTRKFPQSQVMQLAGETVTWTQAMRLVDGELVFEILDGHSTTWGDFGGQGYLQQTTATELTSLNEYSPAVTVQNSGVAFAGNRVHSLKLVRLRIVMSDGVVLEDGTVRVVHELP